MSVRLNTNSYRLRSLVVASLLLATTAIASCARPVMVTSGPPAPAPPLVAPDSFVVAFETSAGRFDVIARRALAPIGVDRFYNLVSDGFFDGARFFRVVPGFVAQFGIPADSAVGAAWRGRSIQIGRAHV